jgi:flavorubredoxin
MKHFAAVYYIKWVDNEKDNNHSLIRSTEYVTPFSLSSNIAEKLGIDDYVAQIIFNETNKKKVSTNNITSNNFLTSYNSEELEEVSQEY